LIHNMTVIARSTTSTMWAWQDAWVAFFSLLALLAWECSGLDIALARAVGLPSGFAWRHHWLMAQVGHDAARWLGWALFAALAASIWRPWSIFALVTRPQRVWWLATTAACVTVVSLLKHASATSCPWSLQEFGGGAAHYVSHGVLSLADGGPGGCFPSGHAATAFAFFAGWFVLRDQFPVLARRWLAGTLIAGTVLGAVQVLRGAHYASHPLWTAWICWCLCALSWHLFQHWQALHD
jgi:membrane-associated PAP2 superfamily phosphatase